MTSSMHAPLFPDERVVWGAGIPALTMFRRGAATNPLVLFLPGGGHLARIAYGHPGALPEDFLLTHLSRAGSSTLALSYPSAHPSIDHPLPAMTITQWAESSAAITADHIAEEQLAPAVVAIGWSLAGRLARDLSVALRRLGIELELFVGLAAAPPIPGFGGLRRTDLLLAPTGLLDGSSERSPIFRSREAELAVVDTINGREVLPRRLYADLYVTDSPINFRGEAERYDNHALVRDIGAAVDDQGSFDFEHYPLCATVSAAGPSDPRHALTDATAWAMLNAQALYFQVIAPALARGSEVGTDPQRWTGLRTVMDALTVRLARHVEGSHFFFLGEVGASATAMHIQDLVDEAASVRRELSALTAEAVHAAG